jgi:hypothetical protein
MENNMCFARRQYCVCSVLLVKECSGFRCAFYKTQEQFKTDLNQANKRLAELNPAAQRYIADRYYDGIYEWLGQKAVTV